MKILIASSGGLDSTACIYKAIQKGHKVYAHFCYIPAPLFMLERLALLDVQKWMKDHFPGCTMEYSESRHTQLSVPIGYIMMAFLKAQEIGADEVQFGADGQPPRFYYPKNDDYDGALWAEKVRGIRLLMRLKIPYSFPVGQYMRGDLAAELPKDLLKLTWSCGFPILKDGVAYTCNSHRCGDCATYHRDGGDLHRERRYK